MRLIIAGCEYAGATTIAHALAGWARDNVGAELEVNDVFKIPHIGPFEMTDDEVAQFNKMPSHLKQVFMWHNMSSHTMPPMMEREDYILVGFQLDEAVYPPLYHGYGRPWEYAEAVTLARHYELSVMEKMPSIVQVLVTASPEVIAERMKEAPHRHSLLQEGDIKHVLQRFEEEATLSLIRKKITLDTSTATVDETLADLIEKMDRHMSVSDLRRIAAHRRG